MRKISGIRRKYLKYTIVLLVLALTLSSVGIGIFVRTSMMEKISGQYEFMTERMGIALDNMYQKSDEVTAECIFYEDVQKSLQTKGLEEINMQALGKYFAYIDLEDLEDYCYVDNRKNVYGRSYSSVSYESVKQSGFEKYLGEDYSKTKWFWTEDTLFGSGEKALFIGRYIRSLDYAHEPGMLFLKMSPRFLAKTIKTDAEMSDDITVGILDEKGELCLSNQEEGKGSGQDVDIDRIREFLEGTNAGGTMLSGERIGRGVLSVYRQVESGLMVFSFVPDSVLNRELMRIIAALAGMYLLVVVAAFFLSLYFSERFTKPIQQINQAMTEFDGNNFQKIAELHTNTELDQIGHSYNEMLGNIESLLIEIKTQEKDLRTSELNMLISQINPHFLYNTLDTIYMLARINKEETTMKMIQALSKYLRLSLSKGSDIVTVEDELENVKSYMEIQQIRNEDLFSYTIDCQVDAAYTWVLKLILQPLVENAIKYGFCDIFEGGKIEIVIKEEKEELCLTVFNSGKPIEEEMCRRINHMNSLPLISLKDCFPDSGHGYGVVNIMTRLRLKYTDEICFSYEREENGTRCTIRIPGGGRLEDETV